jgi:TonB family protein
MLQLALLRPAALVLSAVLWLPDPSLWGEAAAQPPAGRRLEARDGDTIVLEHGARVGLVRRQAAEMRALYNAEEDWLLILVDYPGTPGGVPDRGVDRSYSFASLTGAWPFGARWQGPAVVEEYSMAGETGARGFAFDTAGGRVQLLPAFPESPFRDAADVLLLYRNGSVAGAGGQSFDIVEEQQVAIIRRNAELRAKLPGGGPVSGSGVELSVVGPPQLPGSPGPPPVRAGSSLRQPRPLVQVDPEVPAAARQAGIQGVVILEVAIDAEGRVTDAKVLRSIPMLDQAALDAVRQWRYEPTLLNGKPVPVVITVAMPFPPKAPR